MDEHELKQKMMKNNCQHQCLLAEILFHHVNKYTIWENAYSIKNFHETEKIHMDGLFRRVFNLYH
jgi:hypothetical protein